ncbi:MAG: siderophore-iron reductase FhuF [Aquisalimonadaceae bacterium]
MDDFPRCLDEVLAECWPQLRGRIVAVPASSRSVPLTALLVPGGVDRLIGDFALRYPNQDLRAVASLWAQWSLATTWPPLVVAALVLGAAPRPASIQLLLDDTHTPAGLAVTSEAERAPAQHILQTLVRERTAPLLEAVAVAGGMSPRVPWSNAASILSWTLDQLQVLLPDLHLHPLREMLERRYWPDGSRNPLYVPAARNGRGTSEGRRVCCLRYRLHGFDYCADCPITARQRQTAAVE